MTQLGSGPNSTRLTCTERRFGKPFENNMTDYNIQLDAHLRLARCPQCGVANPSLAAYAIHRVKTQDSNGRIIRFWSVYQCTTCGGLVLTEAPNENAPIKNVWPQPTVVDEQIPARAREFLRQATESAPAGAVILAASAVDAMLKNKGFKDGNLYPRIEKAAAEHLITDEMAKWAHQVRLDANDQRHADETASFPTDEEAQQSIEFAMALGQFLFVLPARVTRGIEKSKPT
jgi:hypothetical protein